MQLFGFISFFSFCEFNSIFFFCLFVPFLFSFSCKNKTFANKAVYCAMGIYNPHKRSKWQPVLLLPYLPPSHASSHFKYKAQNLELMQDLANGTKDVRGAAFQIKSILPFLLLCLQFFRSLSLTLSQCSSYKFLCSFRFISHFLVYYCKRKFRRLTFFRLHFSFFFLCSFSCFIPVHLQ